MLIAAPYMPIAELVSQPVLHSWDSWDPYPALGKLHFETVRRLAQVTDRAIVAYAIGCAEWVVCRFSALSEDIRPNLFLEACWAYIMSDRFAPPPESEEDEWQGPVRAPIDLSLMTVLNTIAFTDTATAENQGAFAELLPLYVLPDSRSFSAWKENALTRLQTFFPRERDHVWGPPVPRQVFDLSSDMSTTSQEKYVQRFLDGADLGNNPFCVPLE